MAPAASPEYLRGRPCGASARRRRAPGTPITTDRTRGESPMPAPADAIRMPSAKSRRARRALAAAADVRQDSEQPRHLVPRLDPSLDGRQSARQDAHPARHPRVDHRPRARPGGRPRRLGGGSSARRRADAVTGRAGSARRRRSVAPLHRPRGGEPAPRAPRARHAAQRGLGALALPDPVQHPADRRGRARAGGARVSRRPRRFRMRRRTGPRPSRTGRPSGRWRGCRSRRAPGTASPWPRAARTRRGRR